MGILLENHIDDNYIYINYEKFPYADQGWQGKMLVVHTAHKGTFSSFYFLGDEDSETKRYFLKI